MILQDVGKWAAYPPCKNHGILEVGHGSSSTNRGVVHLPFVCCRVGHFAYANSEVTEVVERVHVWTCEFGEQTEQISVDVVSFRPSPYP